MDFDIDGFCLKETPSSRTPVTSSLNEISTVSWEMGGGEGGKTFFRALHPHPFLLQASRQTFKDDVNGFSPPRIFASWVLQYNWDRTYSTSIVKL